MQKSRVAILFVDNMNFKVRFMKRVKKGNYIVVKGKLEEVITITNIYAILTSAPSDIKQILIDMKIR